VLQEDGQCVVKEKLGFGLFSVFRGVIACCCKKTNTVLKVKCSCSDLPDSKIVDSVKIISLSDSVSNLGLSGSL